MEPGARYLFPAIREDLLVSMEKVPLKMVLFSSSLAIFLDEDRDAGDDVIQCLYLSMTVLLLFSDH